MRVIKFEDVGLDNIIQLKDNSLDLVMIENISKLDISDEEFDQIISEVYRVLCESGRFIIGFDNISTKFDRYQFNGTPINQINSITRNKILDKCKKFKILESIYGDKDNVICFIKQDIIEIPSDIYNKLSKFLNVKITDEMFKDDKYEDVDYIFNSISYLVNQEIKKYKVDNIKLTDKVLIIGTNSAFISQVLTMVKPDILEIGILSDYYKSIFPELNYVDNINGYDNILIDSTTNKYFNLNKEIEEL